MPISPSMVLRHIKMRLGASHNPLPLSDEDILNLIYEETLYTFSNYYPFMYDITIDGDKYAVPGECGVYIIPVEEKGLEILGISKLFRSEGYYTGSLYPQYNTNNFFEMQMATDIASAVQVPDTFKFIEPNRVEIFPKSTSNYNFMLQIKCIHPPHLGTIPMSLREQFLKLCLLDTKIAIWAILKNYNQLNTAFGTIDMHIEDYENAQQERDELLELWKNNFHKEPNRKRIWFM